ncbi:MAG: dephospho-CoA kinase, partial [Gammaproteobacteria bacterium]|nr:dephospho-CoA kinase [Gammaproteobacteria bacterium]
RQHVRAPYVVLVVPLLFESKFTSLIDRALVVDCSRENQLGRLVERDNIDESLANKMLDQQWSNSERLALADDFIYNNNNEDLAPQINQLHQQYLKISASNQL